MPGYRHNESVCVSMKVSFLIKFKLTLNCSTNLDSRRTKDEKLISFHICDVSLEENVTTF